MSVLLLEGGMEEAELVVGGGGSQGGRDALSGVPVPQFVRRQLLQ